MPKVEVERIVQLVLKQVGAFLQHLRAHLVANDCVLSDAGTLIHRITLFGRIFTSESYFVFSQISDDGDTT